MHFASALFSVLCALTLTLNSALAANICTYASRGCGGSSACCNNIPAGNCCWWSSASLGWSVRMSSMTGSWHAACYGSQSCTNQMASISVGGSTVCKSAFPSPPRILKAVCLFDFYRSSQAQASPTPILLTGTPPVGTGIQGSFSLIRLRPIGKPLNLSSHPPTRSADSQTPWVIPGRTDNIRSMFPKANSTILASSSRMGITRL